MRSVVNMCCLCSVYISVYIPVVASVVVVLSWSIIMLARLVIYFMLGYIFYARLDILCSVYISRLLSSLVHSRSIYPGWHYDIYIYASAMHT